MSKNIVYHDKKNVYCKSQKTWYNVQKAYIYHGTLSKIIVLSCLMQKTVYNYCVCFTSVPCLKNCITMNKERKHGIITEYVQKAWVYHATEYKHCITMVK